MITKMTIYCKAPRRRPQIGDKNLIKGVMHVRQQVMVDHYGKKSYLVRDGKPVCEWVKAV